MQKLKVSHAIFSLNQYINPKSMTVYQTQPQTYTKLYVKICASSNQQAYSCLLVCRYQWM